MKRSRVSGHMTKKLFVVAKAKAPCFTRDAIPLLPF